METFPLNFLEFTFSKSLIIIPSMFLPWLKPDSYFKNVASGPVVISSCGSFSPVLYKSLSMEMGRYVLLIPHYKLHTIFSLCYLKSSRFQAHVIRYNPLELLRSRIHRSWCHVLMHLEFISSGLWSLSFTLVLSWKFRTSDGSKKCHWREEENGLFVSRKLKDLHHVNMKKTD